MATGNNSLENPASQNDNETRRKDNEMHHVPENENCTPSGISDRLWQKFQALKKRREAVSRKSTQKRVKELQDGIFKKVEDEFVQPEDLDVLRQHAVKLPGQCSNKSDTLPDNIATEKQRCQSVKEGADKINEITETASNSQDWQSVKTYLNCNDHLKGVDKGKYAPKTKLHEEIDEAIAKEDYAKAEELSDKLATREFGKNIADAFDAKRYAEKRKHEEEIAKAKRKKKLHWGFEHKQRWETKSNM